MDVQLIEKVLAGIPHGQRRKKVEEIADAMNVHYSTIYRMLAAKNGKQKSIEREILIPQEWIDKVGQIKAGGFTFGDKERELSTERCIRILERTGQIPPGVLTVSSVNRRLRESGFRQKKAARRYEADFANQSQQIDFSRSEYFELIDYDHRAGDYLVMVNARGLSYKNKEGKKQRLWLAQVKDEFSRVRLVRYFAAANEDSLMGLQMLHFAWRREEDEHPLIYVPYYLRTDNGSFAKSGFTKDMLKRLGIEWLPSKVGNKQSMGKVERGWRDLWQWELEEALVRGDKAVCHLSELNMIVHQEMIRELELPHPTRAGKRGDLYRRSLASVESANRRLPVDLVEMATKVIEKPVPLDCRITIKNVPYSVPEEYAGRVIRIVYNAEGKLIGESMDLERRFELLPFKAQSFLQYRGVPDTYQERMGKQYRHDLVEGAHEKKAPAKTESGNVAYLPPHEEEIPVQSPFDMGDASRFAGVEEARRYIGRRLGVPYSEVAELFDELLAVSLDRQVIDELLDEARKAM